MSMINELNRTSLDDSLQIQFGPKVKPDEIYDFVSKQLCQLNASLMTLQSDLHLGIDGGSSIGTGTRLDAIWGMLDSVQKIKVGMREYNIRARNAEKAEWKATSGAEEQARAMADIQWGMGDTDAKSWMPAMRKLITDADIPGGLSDSECTKEVFLLLSKQHAQKFDLIRKLQTRRAKSIDVESEEPSNDEERACLFMRKMTSALKDTLALSAVRPNKGLSLSDDTSVTLQEVIGGIESTMGLISEFLVEEPGTPHSENMEPLATVTVAEA